MNEKSLRPLVISVEDAKKTYYVYLPEDYFNTLDAGKYLPNDVMSTLAVHADEKFTVERILDPELRYYTSIGISLFLHGKTTLQKFLDLIEPKNLTVLFLAVVLVYGTEEQKKFFMPFDAGKPKKANKKGGDIISFTVDPKILEIIEKVYMFNEISRILNKIDDTLYEKLGGGMACLGEISFEKPYGEDDIVISGPSNTGDKNIVYESIDRVVGKILYSAKNTLSSAQYMKLKNRIRDRVLKYHKPIHEETQVAVSYRRPIYRKCKNPYSTTAVYNKCDISKGLVVATDLSGIVKACFANERLRFESLIDELDNLSDSKRNKIAKELSEEYYFPVKVAKAIFAEAKTVSKEMSVARLMGKSFDHIETLISDFCKESMRVTGFDTDRNYGILSGGYVINDGAPGKGKCMYAMVWDDDDYTESIFDLIKIMLDQLFVESMYRNREIELPLQIATSFDVARRMYAVIHDLSTQNAAILLQNATEK